MSVMTALSNDTVDSLGKVLLVSASLMTTAFTMVTLKMVRAVSGLLGTTGINVVTRLMALIVPLVGIKFILGRLKNQLPTLTTLSAGKHQLKISYRTGQPQCADRRFS